MTDNPSRESFEQTALLHVDALYGLALRLTNDPTAAEDLVQEATLRAFRFWHTFSPGTSVKAWLFTILRNTFITRYHANNRQQRLGQALEAHAVSAGEPRFMGEHLQTSADLEATLLRRHTRARIEAALAELPEDYRTTVVLADLEGLSYKEISEVAGCPIGTVMSRLYRGRKQLFDKLKDHAVELGMLPLSSSTFTPTPLDKAETRPLALADYRRGGVK